MLKFSGVAVFVVACAVRASASDVPCEPDQPALEELGKQIFFDPISRPSGQSCSSCHAPAAGWTGGSSLINATQVVMPGAVSRTAGNRKPPTVSYASFSPAFGDFPGRSCTPAASGGSCRGGLFADGRATGRFIGREVFAGNAALEEAYGEFLGPTADQALGPFSNDVEMNVPDGNDDGVPGAEFVCKHVARAHYRGLFEKAWGEPIACDVRHVATSFKRIAVAISAWEHSAEVNSFSSKRDLALATDADDSPGKFPLQRLSDRENQGHDLFFGVTSALNPQGKNARCSACHNSEGSGSKGDEPEQLFTDQRFHDIGVPPNYQAASFDPRAPDVGLSRHTDPELAGNGSRHDGHIRTPTLRNIDKRVWPGFVKAYMHNGYFKRLEEVVHYYNTAIVKLDPVRCPPGTTAAQAMARGCWPAAEVDSGNPASGAGLLGNLGLSGDEEAAIVAYMKTLTDSETVTAPKPAKHARPHPELRFLRRLLDWK